MLLGNLDYVIDYDYMVRAELSNLAVVLNQIAMQIHVLEELKTAWLSHGCDYAMVATNYMMLLNLILMVVLYTAYRW